MKKVRSKSVGVVGSYRKSRKVDPRPITGRERPSDLLKHAFPAYVGRQERTAFELMQRSVREDCSIFLTLSGAMTPAGLHQSCLIPMIQRGIVSVLTTTGANLYHDAHRIIGHAIREVNPDAGDLALRLARIIRIYDLGFWEQALLDTDRLFSAIIRGPEFQRKMTTVEFHHLLGKSIHRIERSLRVSQPSLLSTCYQYGVPVFVGAVQDGSIFLNVGVPKNYTLQGEPLLDQILNVPTTGFDIDLQFCVDPVDNGALSSCPAGEGHTWGKVSVEAVETGSVYVHCDVTAVFPWLTHALLSDPKMKRKPQHLMDRLAEATAFLDRDVSRQRGKLMRTLDWEIRQRDRPRHRVFVR